MHTDLRQRWITFFVLLSLLLSTVPTPVQAQDGGPVWLPFIGRGYTPAPGPDLLFRSRVTVKTSAAWRDLERLDPLFRERGDDWALLLVDDAQLEALARLRYNPDGTDTIAEQGYSLSIPLYVKRTPCGNETGQRTSAVWPSCGLSGSRRGGRSGWRCMGWWRCWMSW